MKENFYRISSAYKRDCIKIQSNVKYNTLQLINDGHILIINNEFNLEKGKKEFDIIEFNDSILWAFSEKVKDLIEKENCKGFDFFELKINGIENKYYHLKNLYIAGPITNLKQINSYKTKFREFDIKTWNGSDLFTLKDTLLVVCTQKVKDALEKAKITNLEILPL